jgi:hypothetical protein
MPFGATALRRPITPAAVTDARATLRARGPRVETIRGLDLRWPEVSESEHEANAEARRQLEAEA